jgi:hypothetical protein
MGIDIPGVAEADAAEDFDLAAEIEAAWLRKHAGDKVRVCWPEHVAVPSYNGDATYMLIK